MPTLPWIPAYDSSILHQTGKIGLVLANGALSTHRAGGEGEIRKEKL